MTEEKGPPPGPKPPPPTAPRQGDPGPDAGSLWSDLDQFGFRDTLEVPAEAVPRDSEPTGDAPRIVAPIDDEPVDADAPAWGELTRAEKKRTRPYSQAYEAAPADVSAPADIRAPADDEAIDEDDELHEADSSDKPGAVGWMARNHVAANLLMAVLIIGGAVVGSQVKQEVFPTFDLDFVTVQVAYPGASPAEVEQGIVLAIEEAIEGIDDIKRITGRAFEGMGTVSAELESGADANQVLSDIKNAVDRVTTLPQDAERPIVNLLENRREVVSLMLYGEQDERALHELAETIRDEMLQLPEVTVVELGGVRPLEIAVEVPQDKLRAHDLTLEQVAGRIRQAALELPGGGVKTDGGEVLIRLAERRDVGLDFADIVVLAKPDGTEVRLRDIATIKDGYADTDVAASFNGQRAVRLNVYQAGNLGPIEIAEACKRFIADHQTTLPPGVGMNLWNDRSKIFQERIDLLMRNARMGLVLVLVVLGLFLEVRLAFWVTMGIPISFLGSLLLMPAMDVSVNMISLFAFIIVLGMVVDDAVVVGENVYEMITRGMPPLRAAIHGARQVAVPVTFSILTTIVAFMPLLFVPGVTGKFFGVIPLIVISVLLISWVESLFVLPAHLGHLSQKERTGVGKALYDFQQRFSKGLLWFIKRLYQPVLVVALRWRYLTIAAGVACLIVTAGWVRGGRIAFSFLPKVESNFITARVALPFGVPVDETREVRDRLVRAAQKVLDEHGGQDKAHGVYATLGESIGGGGPGGSTSVSSGGSHLTAVQVYLVDPDNRAFDTATFGKWWREAIGPMHGVESFNINYSIGASAGAAIDVELSHPDMKVLEAASAELARDLQGFAGVTEIDDGFSAGKPQLDFRVRPEASSAGLTPAELGRQLRSAFYGAEALRQQRGRNEVRVMVRRPEAERQSEGDIESTIIRLPSGAEMPLGRAAEVKRGNAYTSIVRTDGRRVVDVTADVDKTQTTADKVLAALKEGPLERLAARYPGIGIGFEGERRARGEAMSSLGRGFAFAMVCIFALLAIPFRSYVQPLIVMTAIPFGIVGAVMGHILMGFELSIMSMMGIVALSGVVVNDSLVLIDACNRKRREGDLTAFQAIRWAGVRRFRPILLTSLTTFFGLAPMIFETSVQAKFLIPMALSLGYGILFATLIVLLLVPSLYLVVEDLLGVVAWIRGLYGSDERPPSTAQSPLTTP